MSTPQLFALMASITFVGIEVGTNCCPIIPSEQHPQCLKERSREQPGGLSTGNRESLRGESSVEHETYFIRIKSSWLPAFSELPDLVIDKDELERATYLEDRQLSFLMCAKEENCLSASAYTVHPDDFLTHTRRSTILYENYEIRICAEYMNWPLSHCVAGVIDESA